MLVPREESIYIVGTSCLFMVPSIYSYYCHLYSLSVLLAVTSLLSANFWRRPVLGWRRNADIGCAKILFITCVYIGVPCLDMWYIYMSIIIFFYYKSCVAWHVLYHAAFHISAILTAMLIITELEPLHY